MRGRPPIESVLVVVPARDEQDRIAACLGSIRRALDEVAGDLVEQAVVVVADGCTDLTATVARLAWGDDPRLHVVAVPASGPGAARRLGVFVGESVLTRVGSRVDRAAERRWVATTDADTRVPRDWLVRQLRRADAGFDGVAGTVRVDDWSAGDEIVRTRYERLLAAARRPGGDHTDVFGANLGMRGRALRSVGGFPALRIGEDHAVWDRMRALRLPLAQTTDVTVSTSGRRSGRARGGLADLLAGLAVS